MPRVKYKRRITPFKQTCPICGQVFSSYRFDAKTCSTKCRMAMMRRDRKAMCDK